MIQRLSILLALAMMIGQVAASGHFQVLVYHHVAEGTPPSTSVSPDTFRTHLELLRDNNFSVVPLEQALAAVKGEGDATLPERAVVITFDDAYANIHENAFPMLKEFDYPFTIFAATDPIDQNFKEMLSWDQLREMKEWGATIANHSSDHDYMVRHSPRDEAWLDSMRANIRHAQKRLEDELGDDIPYWFAYPYGEYNEGLKRMLDDEGYIGFAQHSGGINANSDFLALPRFAAAGVYANTETLLTKLKSRPMPVDYNTVPDMLAEDNPPVMTITLADTSDMSRSFNCFVNSEWQDGEWVGEQSFRLSAPEPLDNGRHRYNCTSQAKSGSFFYWYSQPWLILGE